MTTPNNTVAGLPEKLLPCPFCGSSASRGEYDTSRGDAFVVCCSNRDCHADVYTDSDSRESADAAWNRRASPAPSATVGCFQCNGTGWIEHDIGAGGSVTRCPCAALSQHPAAPSVSPDRETVEVRVATAVEGGLPELPEPWQCETAMCPKLYTATQMRAYGEQCRRIATAEQPGSAVQGEDWRPIATVPRDGTRVIVWMPEGIPSSASYGPVSEPQATHWMPLHGPACTTPPSALAAEQGESIARKFDRDVLEPLRKKDRATQPEGKGASGKWIRGLDANGMPLAPAPAAPGAAPSGVRVDEGNRMTPYMAKLWLDELLAEQGATLPAETYDAIIAALAGKDGA